MSDLNFNDVFGTGFRDADDIYHPWQRNITTVVPSLPITQTTLDMFRTQHLRGVSSGLEVQIKNSLSIGLNIFEGAINQTLLEQTRQQTTVDFPPNKFPIIMSDYPITEILNIEYIDDDDIVQIIDLVNDVTIDLKTTPQLIYPKNSWPNIKTKPNAVTVEYVVGFGTTDDLPDQFLAPWFEISATHFSQPLSGSKEELKTIPRHLESAINALKRKSR